MNNKNINNNTNTNTTKKSIGDSNKKVILSLKDVYKKYYLGQVPTNALDGVNLDIYEGEILVILGPSGSRKNYLTKCSIWS